MKIFKQGIIVVLALLGVSLGGMIARAPTAEPSQGERLVRQLWAYSKEGKVTEIAKMMGPGFQSIHEDGAGDREAEIQVLEKVNLGKYTLSNFKATQNGPVIIVTYFVSVEETLRGKRLPATKPAARLSAWLKTDRGWQWIIHSNLRSLK